MIYTPKSKRARVGTEDEPMKDQRPGEEEQDQAPDAKPGALYELAMRLRASDASVFERLCDSEGDEQTAAYMPGRVPPEAQSCLICGATKHEHKWMCRRGLKNARRCAGSVCYCCARATTVLKITRSVQALKAAGAIELVRIMCSEIRRGLSSHDVCCCSRCQ
ncbi:unnamed protein product [Durusdinium trenchii]|uniref:Uncharacterized protein n=1 Tax=Durusdinium trenchii TaxID=1381693 RepID=A0ABP0REX1_9DINO